MKTIGPLHLEDLEPHRFEDLVRQLLYDFRTWTEIEAVGRSGSDHGFDARAKEVFSLDYDQNIDFDDELSTFGSATNKVNRMWVVQCKREKSIGPRKLSSYMTELPDVQEHGLYGLIFVAACDFSFAARDVFREKAREKGYAEAYLWGKGEIEDQLFQPKNDHLLFAYFGISLQTKKRTISTSVRARLAVKRKVFRVLEKNYTGRFILVRDASDDRYPYVDGNDKPGNRKNGRWCLMQYEAAIAQGILFKLTEQFAYIADDQKSWDYLESWNSALPQTYENHWYVEEIETPDLPSQDDYFEVWSELPENNKAHFFEYGIIPYENIIDVDENGDQYFEGPHLYIMPYDPAVGPFDKGKFQRIKLAQNWDNSMIKILAQHKISWFREIKKQAEKIRADRQNRNLE